MVYLKCILVLNKSVLLVHVLFFNISLNNSNNYICDYFLTDFKSDASSVPKKPKSSGGLGSLTSINKPVKKAVPPKTKAFTKPKSSIDSLFESLESGTSTVSQNLTVQNFFLI